MRIRFSKKALEEITSVIDRIHEKDGVNACRVYLSIHWDKWAPKLREHLSEYVESFGKV